MLATTLRWHRCGCSFNDLEQGLLNTFTRNVPSDRGVLTFASHLVDFIDVDDSHFSALGIKFSSLNEFEQNVFNVFANITGLGQRGGISDSERNIEHAGKCLRQQCLARAGRS